MSAVVDMRANTSRTLDRKAEPDEVVAEQDVADAKKLARLLIRVLSQLAELRRSFVPQRTTFTNLVVDASGTTVYRLPHRFGSGVSWWIAGWRNASAGPQLIENASSDANTLILVSKVAGTVDVVVEERG